MHDTSSTCTDDDAVLTMSLAFHHTPVAAFALQVASIVLFVSMCSSTVCMTCGVIRMRVHSSEFWQIKRRWLRGITFI
ncbi:hypothetical protein PCAR4_200034 [Paraburkholderia caribensis]|nr:hypothetical protein PCAR4_200034 [Paraburkholderia caribensis]